MRFSRVLLFVMFCYILYGFVSMAHKWHTKNIVLKISFMNRQAAIFYRIIPPALRCFCSELLDIYTASLWIKNSQNEKIGNCRFAKQHIQIAIQQKAPTSVYKRTNLFAITFPLNRLSFNIRTPRGCFGEYYEKRQFPFWVLPLFSVISCPDHAAE